MSNGVSIRNSVIFRTLLPAVRIHSGSNNLVADNLACVGIFSGTHRGAFQGAEIFEIKLTPMMGMFHNQGHDTMMVRNVAAGSERAGFTGPGVLCSDDVSFAGNEAFSALAGYWFDFYSWQPTKRHVRLQVNHKKSGHACVGLKDFTAWKIWEYGVYGEPQQQKVMHLQRISVADARVAILIVSGGFDSLDHTLGEKKVVISDSLIVGHSANGNCLIKKPSLYTCKFYMAWCFILPFYNTGILFGSFPKSQNDGPKIHSWFETAPEPSLYGITEITSVTFANFSAPCAGVQGPRKGKRDLALASMPSKANPADQTAPLIIQDLRTHAVDDESLFFFHQTDPKCKCSSVVFWHLIPDHEFFALRPLHCAHLVRGLRHRCARNL